MIEGAEGYEADANLYAWLELAMRKVLRTNNIYVVLVVDKCSWNFSERNFFHFLKFISINEIGKYT